MRRRRQPEYLEILLAGLFLTHGISICFPQYLIASIKQELRNSHTGHDDATSHFNILALSGGSSYGAFGAGILNGWSAAGTRPIFKIVTGISTGALIAPYPFSSL